MARKEKERAYIAPYENGYFMFEKTIMWMGKNAWGNSVAWGRTRKECERDCRRNGYVPVRDN